MDTAAASSYDSLSQPFHGYGMDIEARFRETGLDIASLECPEGFWSDSDTEKEVEATRNIDIDDENVSASLASKLIDICSTAENPPVVGRPTRQKLGGRNPIDNRIDAGKYAKDQVARLSMMMELLGVKPVPSEAACRSFFLEIL
ncbi:hypothetical protein RUND412_008428 [Rhizina undulata]